MKTGTKILIGAGTGLGALLIGRKVYLDSLSDDDPAAVNMQGDSFGDTRSPAVITRRETVVVPKSHRATSRDTGNPGILKVKIRKPECEIAYNEKHYKGTGLEARYDNGEIISWSKGNSIMQWTAWDGPESRYTTSSGRDPNIVNVTGNFYIKYLGLDEYTAVHKKLGSHPPLQEQWDWDMQYGTQGRAFGSTPPPRPTDIDVLGFWQGKSSGAAQANADHYLTSKGYRLVKIDYGKTAKLTLNPGWYQIIAEPVWQKTQQRWRYLQGYWGWTNDGPRGKSAAAQFKKFKNGGCTNKLTQFYRVVEQDRWADISSLVQVISNEVNDVDVAPLVNLAITNRATKKNGYSRAFNSACNTYKGGELVFKKIMGFKGQVIWWLAERFFGKMVYKHSV